MFILKEKAISTSWISRSYPYKYILALTKEKRGKKSQWFTQINLSGGIKTSSWSKKMRLRVCCFVRHWSWNLLIRKDLCHIPNRFYQSAAICRSAANEILRFFYLSFFLLLRSEMILNSHWGEQIKKLFIYEPVFEQRLLEAASLSDEKRMNKEMRNLFIHLINALNYLLSSSFNSSAFQTYSIIQIKM